jgi:hypothetical protein
VYVRGVPSRLAVSTVGRRGENAMSANDTLNAWAGSRAQE